MRLKDLPVLVDDDLAAQAAEERPVLRAAAHALQVVTSGYAKRSAEGVWGQLDPRVSEVGENKKSGHAPVPAEQGADQARPEHSPPDGTQREPFGPLTRDGQTPLGDTPEAHDEIIPQDLPRAHPGRIAAERQAAAGDGTTRGDV